VTVALALIAAVATTPAAARAQAAAEDSSAESALRTFWSAIDVAWNERDAERFSELFTEDASLEFVDRGVSLEPRTAIHEHFAERFPGFAPDLRHLTTVRDSRVIAPDLRTLDGRVEILRIESDESTAPTVLRTFSIFAVMARSEEGWRVRALRIYQLPAADGTGAAVP
jgi:uncharacterized protein (TIGR02246 family)